MVSSNIKSGVTIFGVSGTLEEGYTGRMGTASTTVSMNSTGTISVDGFIIAVYHPGEVNESDYVWLVGVGRLDYWDSSTSTTSISMGTGMTFSLNSSRNTATISMNASYGSSMTFYAAYLY